MEGKELVNSFEITRTLLDFEGASPQAKQWWKELELLNKERPTLVSRLADELVERNASIDDFYLACSYSNRQGVQDNLDFLDLIYQDRFAQPRPIRVNRPIRGLRQRVRH